MPITKWVYMSLLDFSTTSHNLTGFTSEVETKIETYFAHPTLNINPLKFWTETKESIILSRLATAVFGTL